MLGPITRIAALMPLAMMHVACSSAVKLAGDDRYANCADLGDLSLQANSRAEAERRLRVRVLELGGDTLLFGERGRAGRLDASPAEIVERRNVLLARVSNERPAGALAAEQPEEPEALETADSNAARRRSAVLAAEALGDSPGELWFYGAALRCRSTGPLQ